MRNPFKAWRMHKARRDNAVYLVDTKGRLLNPRIVFSNPSFEIMYYDFPYLLISSPANRTPQEFEYTWDEILEGNPFKERIMGTLGFSQGEDEGQN